MGHNRRVVTEEEFERLVQERMNDDIMPFPEDLARGMVHQDVILAAGTREPADPTWGGDFPDLTQIARSWGVTAEERREQDQDRQAEELGARGARPVKSKSSYLKMIERLPRGVRRAYLECRRLAKLNPRADGSYDLSVRQLMDLLRCSIGSASSYLVALRDSGLTPVVSRASFAEGSCTTYRIASLGELDFEAVDAYFLARRNRMTERRLKAGYLSRLERNHVEQTLNSEGSRVEQTLNAR